jgi:hypothetical protein
LYQITLGKEQALTDAKNNFKQYDKNDEACGLIEKSYGFTFKELVTRMNTGLS